MNIHLSSILIILVNLHCFYAYLHAVKRMKKSQYLVDLIVDAIILNIFYILNDYHQILQKQKFIKNLRFVNSLSLFQCFQIHKINKIKEILKIPLTFLFLLNIIILKAIIVHSRLSKVVFLSANTKLKNKVSVVYL